MDAIKIFQYIWYASRAIRQSFNLLYIKTIGSCSYKSIGKNTIFDGIPDLVAPFSNIHIGDNSRVGKNCVMYTSRLGSIDIGNNVSINNNTHITAHVLISIGDNTLIAEGVGIRDHDHRFSSIAINIREQGYSSKPIIICPGVWIGRNSSILKGVTIGEGAIIGANSVVTRDVPPYSINVGSPSKVIRFRRDTHQDLSASGDSHSAC